MKKTIPALAIAMAMTSGCMADNKQAPVAPSQNNEPMQRALIVGSAEAPDPVLTRVRELEKSGVVRDVLVLESFPVQIHLSAPQRIIDELNRIPRVGGLR